MKRYVIFVENEEVSWQVQEKLFEAGFRWSGGGNQAQHRQEPFLHLNHTIQGEITRCSNFARTVRDAKENNIIPLNSRDIIKNGAAHLDGAPPYEEMVNIAGKYYSISTIKAALQEYVK